MKIFLKLLLLYAMLFGALPGRTQTPSPDRLPVTMIVFGNNISKPRKGIEKVYVQWLPELLTQKGIEAKIINSGGLGNHSGRQSDNNEVKGRHGLDRFKEDVLDRNPDLVVISFGLFDAAANTVKKDGSSRISVPAYRRNLAEMITQLQDKGIKVLLMASNPRGGLGKVAANARLLQYVEVDRELSKKYKTGFSDNYELFAKYEKETGESFDLLMADSIFPNDKGHEMIARQLAGEVEQMYQKDLKKKGKKKKSI